MSQQEIDAGKIADIFTRCNSDHRGDLMMEIARRLKKNTQFYTASLFESIAHRYGFSEKGKPSDD